ncbi:MAG TPA: ribosomal protein L7/L12 [Polyangiales bacterium]
MQAKSGQRASAVDGDAFDVRIVAFAVPRSRQLQALQQVFGLDVAAAQRVVEALPSIARSALPAADAERAQRALESLGAEVELEPVLDPAPARPIAPRARAGPPPPPTAAVSFDPLPKPIMRMPTADLEFDMESIEEDVDLEESLNADLDDPGELKGLRKPRNEELELDAGNAGVLDLDHPAPQRQAAKPKPRPVKPSSARSADGAREAAATTESGANTTISRAAVVQPVATVDKRARRSRAVVQLMAAVLVFGLGLYFDNSVLFGNASWFSVLAHGLAIQQFGSALWALIR